MLKFVRIFEIQTNFEGVVPIDALDAFIIYINWNILTLVLARVIYVIMMYRIKNK